MPHIHAIGTIATDPVRRETTNGVLTTFRLASGQPGRGQLWIDVDTWGHQAGIVNTHGSTGRSITVSGRLTHKSWRDRNTGDERHKLAITATDLDFHRQDHDIEKAELPNHVIVTGRVKDQPILGQSKTGPTVDFTVTSGTAGNKTGKLWLPCQAWGRTTDTADHLHAGVTVSAAGRLSYRSGEANRGEHYLSVFHLDAPTPGVHQGPLVPS